MSALRILGLVSSLLLLPALATGQDASVARTSHGVQVTPEGAWAGGPDYSARFDGRGVEFTPALGAAAAKPFPVRFTLDSVRRGANDVFVRTADVMPAVEGDQVRYVHRGDLVEVYDVRAEGIEQSFVFATKPAGSGDLVVRGRITTELPLAAAGDDGVRYELPGTGGVTFGAVTGVDANGASARGSIRVTGDHLEWVLPASFVENAKYPLVLDPLIGSAFLVGDAPGLDLRPAVAFDQTTARYLVAWTVVTSASSSELRGQLVTVAGTTIGSLMLLSGAFTAHQDMAPVVANVNVNNRFLVVWRTRVSQVSFVLCAAVSASTGTVSSVTQITGGSSIDYQFAVGGDLRAAGDKCLLAYTDSTFATAGLRIVTVQVPATGAPVLGTPLILQSGAMGSVAVSRSAGTAGRWLVAWTQNSPSPGTFADVKCAAVSEVGTQCSVATVLDTNAAGDVGGLTCATADGDRFVVGWQDNVTGRVRVRPVTLTGLCPATIAIGTTVEPSAALGAQTSPSLDFAKEKYALTWTQSIAGTGLRTFVKGLEPTTCASCGTEHAVEASGSTQEQSAVAARWSGGDAASDEALVVWSTGAIRGTRFEARSNDVVASMGGGCSVSGFDDFATYSGDAVLGNTNFQLAIAGSVSLPLVLILGFSNLSAPCGSCTIVPSLDILLPGTNPTTLAIPCDPLLVGQDLYTQWLLLKPSDCPILPDFAFSNALRFTIGE